MVDVMVYGSGMVYGWLYVVSVCLYILFIEGGFFVGYSCFYVMMWNLGLGLCYVSVVLDKE